MGFIAAQDRASRPLPLHRAVPVRCGSTGLGGPLVTACIIAAPRAPHHPHGGEDERLGGGAPDADPKAWLTRTRCCVGGGPVRHRRAVPDKTLGQTGELDSVARSSTTTRFLGVLALYDLRSRRRERTCAFISTRRQSTSAHRAQRPADRRRPGALIDPLTRLPNARHVSSSFEERESRA